MPANNTPLESSVNPTLMNGDFPSAAGWLQRGGVAIGAGSATLGEVAAEQSSLRQVFTVGVNDNFLRFTLSAVELHQAAGGVAGSHVAPADAFEVALLDAHTGTALRSIDGLSHCDAFLNLQCQGPARAADALHVSTNPVGSTTYTLDLGDVAAGTAVPLSFDLIAFGDQDSHVTIRDIRLLRSINQAPVAMDAIVSTAEDTPVRIDVIASAQDADGDVLSAFVVTPPQHGELAQDADGSFRYTPHADFFGADSFTYRVSDGSLDSNVARVNIEVTPVNDAPVAVDVAASTAEDTPVRIDVLAGARDVDSSALTASVVTPPQHGELAQDADGSFRYTPHADYFGADSFTYHVSDGELDSNVARVEIDVAPVNDSPVAGGGTCGRPVTGIPLKYPVQFFDNTTHISIIGLSYRIVFLPDPQDER